MIRPNTCHAALAGAALLALGSLWPTGTNAAEREEKVVQVPTRPGITVKFILRGQPHGNPPIVVLFAGGNGLIDLDAWNGKGNPAGNFLVRTRKHWVKHGLLVAVPDAPSDRKGDGLLQWRTSRDHAADIRAIIAYLRRLSTGPAFLVGTSAGSISAAGAAARLPPGELSGIALTASVTRYARSGRRDRVQSVDLEKIRVPVLLAHHEDDQCYVTVPDDVAGLAKEFTNAPGVTIRMYRGGKNYYGPDCGSRTAHGFRGIEKEVVADIAAWIHRIAGQAR
ncbi:MAG: alpha/beta hydrolase [Alphaproteobacteria bacterium]|nr:alpha/beta hydrolase [Alphaproteobacteria bacterium]